MKTITTKEFTRCVKDVDHGLVPGVLTEYLNATCAAMPDGNGKVMVSDDFEDKLKSLTSEIRQGDLVWSNDNGFLLIVDLHPKISNDGHHYRAFRTKIDSDGLVRIAGSLRSIVVDKSRCLRIRPTTFNLTDINRLSYERYQMYARITEIDTLLDAMKEKTHAQ